MRPSGPCVGRVSVHKVLTRAACRRADTHARGRGKHAGRLAQRTVQIGDDVLDTLQAYRDPHHAVAQTDGGPALRTHRAVGGGGRVGDQRLGIAEVVGDVDQGQLVENLEGPLFAAALRCLKLEGDDGATAGHLPDGQVILRMRRQERVAHPPDTGMGLQEFRDP